MPRTTQALFLSYQCIKSLINSMHKPAKMNALSISQISVCFHLGNFLRTSISFKIIPFLEHATWVCRDLPSVCGRAVKTSPVLPPAISLLSNCLHVPVWGEISYNRFELKTHSLLDLNSDSRMAWNIKHRMCQMTEITRRTGDTEKMSFAYGINSEQSREP